MSFSNILSADVFMLHPVCAFNNWKHFSVGIRKFRPLINNIMKYLVLGHWFYTSGGKFSQCSLACTVPKQWYNIALCALFIRSRLMIRNTLNVRLKIDSIDRNLHFFKQTICGETHGMVWNMVLMASLTSVFNSLSLRVWRSSRDTCLWSLWGKVFRYLLSATVF